MTELFKNSSEWLTPLAQEVEIRRIEVKSQSGQIVRETLSRKNPSQKGLVEWLRAGPEFKPQYWRKK
jgi:hypothetical protein